MEGNLKEGDHHCGDQPDVDHFGVGRCWQGLSLADETEKRQGQHLKWRYDSHGGQDKEHGEVDLDHHVNVLCVPGVRKVAARIEITIFIILSPVWSW